MPIPAFLLLAVNSLRHYRLWSQGIPQHSSPCISDLQHNPQLPRIFTLIFLGSQDPIFLHLNSLSAKAVVRFLTGSSVSCLFINGKIRTCHLCLVQMLPKFTTSLYQLQLASRFMLDSLKIQFWVFYKPLYEI